MTSDEEAAQGVGLHAAAAGIVAKLVFADGPYAEVSGQGMCQVLCSIMTMQLQHHDRAIAAS